MKEPANESHEPLDPPGDYLFRDGAGQFELSFGDQRLHAPSDAPRRLPVRLTGSVHEDLRNLLGFTTDQSNELVAAGLGESVRWLAVLLAETVPVEDLHAWAGTPTPDVHTLFLAGEETQLQLRVQQLLEAFPDAAAEPQSG